MRKSGILLPVFSLPGEFGIGCFSDEAYGFIDFLKEAGQSCWQILPLGPTGYGDSPYQAFSTFAGNPYFIDLKQLIKQECAGAHLGEDPGQVDYGKLFTNRMPLLEKAYSRSRHQGTMEFERFREQNAFWLSDYALFMAVKDFHGGAPLSVWDSRRRG